METVVRRLGGTTAVVAAFVLTAWVVAGRANMRSRRPPTASSASVAETTSSAPAWPSTPEPSAAAKSPVAPASVRSRQPTGGAPPRYDTRSFERMAQDWERETDDPEWSLNIRTFIGAILETLDDGADARDEHGLAGVRCRLSVCRIDFDAGDPRVLQELLESSRQQQSHMAYSAYSGDAGLSVEAYLSRQLAEPSDAE